MTQPCTCGHPQGWHYQDVGSCLECSCLRYRAWLR